MALPPQVMGCEGDRLHGVGANGPKITLIRAFCLLYRVFRNSYYRLCDTAKCYWLCDSRYENPDDLWSVGREK